MNLSAATVSLGEALRKFAWEFVNVVLLDSQKNQVLIAVSKYLSGVYICLVDTGERACKLNFLPRAYNSTKVKPWGLGNREDLRTC